MVLLPVNKIQLFQFGKIDPSCHKLMGDKEFRKKERTDLSELLKSFCTTLQLKCIIFSDGDTLLTFMTHFPIKTLRTKDMTNKRERGRGVEKLVVKPRH